MVLVARDYRTGNPIEIHLAGERIGAIAPADATAGQLPWVAPGMIDIQVNGFGGIDFDDPNITAERWRSTARMLLGHGVTTVLPTFCTNSQEGFVAALDRYRQALADPLLAHVMPGVHVEGPFISDQDGPRGAHNRKFTRNPSMEEADAFNQACGGRLRILTLAPERDGATEVVRELTRKGVVVSIAHTMANPEQLDAAVRAGARFSTHLGNGSHPMINRHRNYFYDQLADDRLWASVIPDSHHVPAALFNIVLRAKGLDRLVFTSDSCGPAGMPPGRYGNSELLPNGRLQVADNPLSLAGSSIALDFAVGKAVEMAKLTLAQSIDLATVQPAKLMGFLDRGRLEAGATADLVLFTWDPTACKMTVLETFVQGRKA